MKEPYLGTPDEDGIRRHFAKQLPADTPIEIIPHTKVWATADGVLLWDPKNGYADLTKRRIEPVEIISLKNVIYLHGDKGTGKTMLVELMHNAVELNKGAFIGFMDLTRAIQKNRKYETVVITNNSTTPQAFNFTEALAIWCRERKINYKNINLK